MEIFVRFRKIYTGVVSPLLPGNWKKILISRYAHALFFMLLASGCRHTEDVNPDKQILSFVLGGVKTQSVRIDDSAGSIEVVVPYGTILSGLSAEIGISPGTTIVPAGSVARDFAKPIYYTVTATDGSKKVYVVHVTSALQSQPVITGFSADTVRAGEPVVVSGNNFGRFGAAIKTQLIDPQGQEVAIPATLLDSARIQFVVPLSTTPGCYKVQIIKNGIASASERRICIKIPAPEITAIKVRNIVQGDSIILAGNYIEPQRYDYRLQLEGASGMYFLTPAVKENGKLIFKTDQGLSSGIYGLSLLNVQESVTGQRGTETLRIYDANLPFVNGIKNKQTTYKASESVVLFADQFEKIQTRFYQVRLHEQGLDYNINGIYSASEKLLSFTLPMQIKPGNYQITVLFTSDSGQQLYDVDLDERLSVKE